MLVLGLCSSFFIIWMRKVSCILLFFFFYFLILMSFSGGWMFFFGMVVDKFSFLLSLMLCWVIFILFFCVFKYKGTMNLKLNLCLAVLGFALLFSFFLGNLLGFYIFFELSLLPLIFVIMGWGYQVERVSASFYLLIYTLVGSFPLLLVFLILSLNQSNLNWWILNYVGGVSSNSFNLIFLLVFIFSFSIKLPLYLLHLWLPKAHVEAPAVGSMILAAILLKLSAYGLYRVVFLADSFLSAYKEVFLVLLLYGAFMSALICLMQSDIKALIAYSSISHMGVLLAGFLVQDFIAMQGVWIIIMSHAFCSSALFFLANFQYERNLSRQLVLVRGQGHNFYYVSGLWVIFLFINFSVPPFLSLLGELEVVMALFSFNCYYFFILGLVMFFVAAYCVYCFSTMVHGMVAPLKSTLGEQDMIYLILMFHFFPLIFLVFKMDLLFL